MLPGLWGFAAVKNRQQGQEGFKMTTDLNKVFSIKTCFQSCRRYCCCQLSPAVRFWLNKIVQVAEQCGPISLLHGECVQNKNDCAWLHQPIWLERRSIKEEKKTIKIHKDLTLDKVKSTIIKVNLFTNYKRPISKFIYFFRNLNWKIW